MPRAPRNHSKTYKVPRRPFESARLDAELKLAGEYGLRNKREIWRIGLVLSKIRRAARELLKLDDKDPKRLFEGNALIRRLVRIGVLDESRMRLDYVLSLKIEDFLERRLQTQVFKSGLAKSIHHARVLIRQRHIRVGKQIVNVPSFVVRLDSQKHIDFALNSPYGGGRPGRVKRKRAAAAAKKEDGDDEDEEIILPDGNIKVDTSSPSVMGFADVFRQDLISVTSFDTISLVSESNPSEGPIQGSREAPVILMSIDSSLDYHYFNGKSSDEGYEIHITAFAGTIRAKEPIGIWWGTRTVLQQVVAAMGSSSSNTEIRLSLGTLSDFPGWEVRGFMLDAGRHWFEASFLADLCIYASFFKLNEFHLHASDNLWNPAFLYGEGNEGWKNLYAAFRFRPSAGSKIEGLVPSYRLNETWTKADFIAMQDTCTHHGIRIVPEIDTPGHSLVISQWKPELMEIGQPDHLNLSHPDTIPTIKSIWDEFLPWFLSPEVSIGADEYDASLANDYILFGTNEPSDTFSISPNVTIQHWNFPGDDIPIRLMQSGYQVINSEQTFLYLDEKTSEGGQFPQTLNEDLMWGGAPGGAGWAPNIFSQTDATNNTHFDNPNLRGSIMALWCDWGNNASTHLEIYYQLSRSLALFGEKTWSGSGIRASALTREEFNNVFPVLNSAALGQNLNRVVKPENGDTVFEYLNPRIPQRTVFDSVGPPYVLSFSVMPSSASPSTGVLFAGIDSKLHVSNLTFEAKGQLYSLGYTLPATLQVPWGALQTVDMEQR
ncbi:hypothetical protein NLI96_g5560 [Meripilus lineatus]|uniref:beta-N-acetylhexosaminidase n=1 Tax=Meripilus lineatus TaxID=2056292 RepID=A0AAD5YEQ1_9APHY|nr:hypothetical protein NLI96_g5560 [Physisporinus lineatus]